MGLCMGLSFVSVFEVIIILDLHIKDFCILEQRFWYLLSSGSDRIL